MQVIISRDEKKLKKHLSSNCKNDYLQYIYLGCKTEEIVQLLNKCSAKEIKIKDNIIDEISKDEFIKSYLDLIGYLGLKHNSLYWWATFTSSKNKFISKLLPKLFLFYSIINTSRANSTKNILIINPPEAIVTSIAKYCHRNSIGLEIFESPLTNIINKVKQKWQLKLNQLVFLFNTWRKIYISHRVFKKRFKSEINANEDYYVLRSWFYARSINENNEYVDSFFGILPEHISKHKKLIIIAGIIGDYRSISKKIVNYKDHFIIPQEYFLKYSDPIKAILAVTKNKVEIKENIEFLNLDVTDIVKSELSKDYAETAVGEYLHSYYIKRMLKLFNINTFTTTYENNPWEKVCFITLKESSPSTNIIGYQHAVLSRSSLNMFLSGYEKDIIPIPDKIITIGKVTKTILEKYGHFNPDKIKEGCGLRFQHLFDVTKNEYKKNYNILVTPEGVLNESVNLVNFVHAALKDYAGINVIIRPHPALPFEKFRAHLNFDINSSPGFSISKNDSVKKDLEMTDIVIYRGSSLSIEALKMGVPVIYIDFNDLLSVDPLFESESFKWVVRTEKKLFDTINNIYDMPDNVRKEKQLKADSYINNYIYKITDKRLNEFLL